jgi:hypothetical protein
MNGKKVVVAGRQMGEWMEGHTKRQIDSYITTSLRL